MEEFCTGSLHTTYIVETMDRVKAASTRGVVFLTAIVHLIIPETKIVGVLLLAYSVLLMGLSPWLLRMLYLGKFWEQHCWLFGFGG
jgi:hypothetical protein